MKSHLRCASVGQLARVQRPEPSEFHYQTLPTSLLRSSQSGNDESNVINVCAAFWRELQSPPHIHPDYGLGRPVFSLEILGYSLKTGHVPWLNHEHRRVKLFRYSTGGRIHDRRRLVSRGVSFSGMVKCTPRQRNRYWQGRRRGPGCSMYRRLSMQRIIRGQASAVRSFTPFPRHFCGMAAGSFWAQTLNEVSRVTIIRCNHHRHGPGRPVFGCAVCGRAHGGRHWGGSHHHGIAGIPSAGPRRCGLPP